MFNSALIAVKPTATPSAVVDYALGLSRQTGIELAALCVIDRDRLAPSEAVPLGGGAFKTERDEQRVAEAQQHALAQLDRFQDACRRATVVGSSRIFEGDVPAVIATAARSVDLVICGHTPGGDAGERSLLSDLVKHAVRPVIVVPQTAAAGDEILVAYDGSAQAARAVASFAASGIAGKRRTFVLSLHSDVAMAKEQAETASTFLRRHGVAAEPVFRAPGAPLETELVEEARHRSAGLLVMGCFGQNVIREFLFGSLTQSLLKTLPLPVFLDH